VIGDLAGYAAASYLRGVAFLQVPTSLLAMVDSSVGGKTGINLKQGKNLVGAFYQPQAVSINLDTLDSLPEREYLSGLAEVVKYGLIYDADFFALLENEQESLLARDKAILSTVVARCCQIKADVVAQDEKEGGLRAILNYGHTLGHAIEAVCGYGCYLHGEAIAIGMAYANELSRQTLGLSDESCARITTLLARFGLPVALSNDVGWDALRAVMSTDKKAQRGLPKFVLIPEIGHARFGCEVSEDILRRAYTEICSHPEGV
jgi:3-dehydroquinate synthase